MPFTARYVFTLEDYSALLAAARSRRRFGFWPLRIFVIAVLLFIWGMPRLLAGPSDDPAPGAPQLALILLPFFIFYAVWELLLFHTTLSARIVYRQCSVAGQALTYEIGEKGLAWTRENMRGEYNWGAFEAVLVTPGGIALLAGKREWLLLPLRAFASKEEFEAAAGFVRANVPVKKAAPAA